MNKYMFILGRDRELSYYELLSYFKIKNIKYNLILKDNEVVIFSLDKLNVNIDELGGTVKIGEIIDVNTLNFDKDKVKYVISVYKGEDVKDIFKEIFKEKGIKGILKRPKRGKGLLPSDFKNIDFEIMVYNQYIVRTTMVSNPMKYEELERKPYFDVKKTISIRLAKMLINLSEVREGEILVDPFCGTGTILQEGLLRNIRIKGMEKDKETYEGCRKNIKWLEKKFNVKSSWEIILGNSSKEKLEGDVMVTEPYMGPFLKKKIKEKEAKEIKKELEKLYFDVLGNVKFRRGVMVVPRFKVNREIMDLDFDNILKNLGLKKERYFDYSKEGWILRGIYCFSKI